LNEIGVFIELIYPADPRPATVLAKLSELTYPTLPKDAILLFVDATKPLSKVESEDKLINPRVESDPDIVLIVLGSPFRVLRLAFRVAALIYPRFPRPAVNILAFLESTIEPRLHMAARYVSVIFDSNPEVLYVILENELRVQGRFPTASPPDIRKVDNIGVQVVPPLEFVRRTFPGSSVSPVFESTANTLRRTILSDILFF
jgi:hypothetical protein